MNCPNCKRVIADDSTTCIYCLSATTIKIPQTHTQPLTQELAPSPTTKIPSFKNQGIVENISKNKIYIANKPKSEQRFPVYAGFLIRAAAYIFDYAIIFILLVIFYIFIDLDNFSNDWIGNLFFWILLITYHSLFTILFSKTPGKALWSLQIIDSLDHTKPSFFQAIGRSISYFISTIIFFIGFLLVAFDRQQHKALHDRMARTYVIRVKKQSIWAYILSTGMIIITVILMIIGLLNSDFSDDDFRYNARQIQNDLNINKDIFTDDFNGIQNPTTTKNNNRNVNQQLAAIVQITCPNNNGIRMSSGSGTIISKAGLILTNQHVISDADLNYCEIGITNDLSNKPEYIYYATHIFEGDNGEYTLISEDMDIAVLQIVEAFEGYTLPKEFPTISKTGSSDKLNINDKVYVAGYPSFGGGTITYTDGIISGRVGDDFLKTSAKVDAGNSGGAVFNEQGEYIGIPTLLFKGRAEGLGYILGIDSIFEWLGWNN